METAYNGGGFLVRQGKESLGIVEVMKIKIKIQFIGIQQGKDKDKEPEKRRTCPQCGHTWRK